EGGPVGWPAAPFHVALQLRTVGAHATLSAVDVEQVRATPERPREERNQPQPSPKPAISTHALRHREKLFILRSTRKSRWAETERLAKRRGESEEAQSRSSLGAASWTVNALWAGGTSTCEMARLQRLLLLGLRAAADRGFRRQPPCTRRVWRGRPS